MSPTQTDRMPRRSPRDEGAESLPRLPRGAGWLLAGALSVSMWLTAIQALHLVWMILPAGLGSGGFI
jgi:hypothetical protein